MPAVRDYEPVVFAPQPGAPAPLSVIQEEILELKRKRNAVILAHNYQVEAIQRVADFVGDSLGLSYQAAATQADVIVFCGVHFMAETAKIVNPSRRVLLPEPRAGCSLADACPADRLADYRAAHPDVYVVAYINCSAAVKALSDVIVTSSSAERILRQIPTDTTILFAPDRHLGAYLERKLSRTMVLWPGTCVVHEQFSYQALVDLKVEHPRALVAAHPECPETILALADHVGSTSSILRYVQESPASEFLIATEPGIIHQMEKLAPAKRFIPVPGGNGECACNVCPYMRRNTLANLHACLRDGAPLLQLPEALRIAALKPLERMLSMAAAPSP